MQEEGNEIRFVIIEKDIKEIRDDVKEVRGIVAEGIKQHDKHVSKEIFELWRLRVVGIQENIMRVVWIVITAVILALLSLIIKGGV